LAEIKKALAERMLNAQLDQHLEGEAAGSASNGEASSNHRNGYSKKTVSTDTSQMELEIPSDRRGTFEPQLISTVTDAVLEEFGRWQNRPLDALYAIVFFDALRVKMRDEGTVRNKAVYLAIGVNADGRKDVLGIWIEQ
jgi:putative transposase